jgi:hypothetical protein
VAGRASRAYKLKLSERGIGLFLACHSRLCGLANDLLPYGTTLRVAVAMLERLTADELAAEVASDELGSFAGKETHFVGTSPDLALKTAALTKRASSSDLVGITPQSGAIFLAGLVCMRESEDVTISKAYEALCDHEEHQRTKTG